MNIFKFTKHFSKRFQKELLTNPEFDKIFPEFLNHNKPPTSIPQEGKEYPYVESLSLYRKTTQQHPTYEDAQHHNFITFVEGFQAPRGPLKELSEDQKKAINVQIDAKLAQLEASGLSRQEILTAGVQTGIPLTQDEFFQYIKNNVQARYIYLSPNEEYTVQKVVDLALRQDIGKDQLNGVAGEYENVLKLQKSRFQNDLLMSTKNPIENINELIKDEVIYHPKVQDKKQRLKQRMRRVNNYDIHWRNTEFLTQFLNKSGKIRNQFQTLLSKVQQKKVSREIKTARQMMLLPYVSALQPFHKRSLTTLQKDMDDYSRRKINVKTGHVYMETKQQQIERSVEHLALQDDFELSVGTQRPNEANKDLLRAQIYAETLKKKQLDEKGIKIEEPANRNLSTFTQSVNFKGIRDEEVLKRETINSESTDKYKEKYEEIKEQVKKVPAAFLTEAILYENAYNLEKVRQLSQRYDKKDVKESIQFINSVKRRAGLQDIII